MYDYVFLENDRIVVVAYDDKVHKAIFETLHDIERLGLEELDFIKIKTRIKRAYYKAAGVAGISNRLCYGFRAVDPETGRVAEPLSDIIIRLNDKYKWSREQIADWLDTLPEQPVMKMEL